MLLAAFFLWQSAFELTKIDIEGLHRFAPAGVLKVLDLQPGAKAGAAEFNVNCQRLIQTGLFESCNWKYAPTAGRGVTVTFQVKEAEAGQKVRLSMPGVADQDLWAWLRANEPLVLPQMPASDDAIQFYTRAIQRFANKDVISSVDTNLETRENTLVFRPANVPSINSVKFTGAHAIDAAVLEKKLTPIAKGTPFTEFEMNKLLDLNIRPMYENLGRLNVQFSSIKAEGGDVTIQVEEGAVYTLTAATIEGIAQNEQPKLPIGQTAEWDKIAAALETKSKELRDKGFLATRYKADRRLDNAAAAVTLSVVYTPGRQFSFHALQLLGLNTPQESNIRALWTLPAGAPMNESYIADFLRAAFGKLGPEFSGVSHQLEPAGASAVDVVIKFSRK